MPNPDTHKGLTGIFDSHARPNGICQPQGRGANTIDIVVKGMIPLSSHFVDTVDICRPQQMVLTYGNVLWLAVDLTSAREHNANLRVMFSTRLQDGELCPAVDFQIRVRIVHGIQMARLTREIKQIVSPLDQIAHTMLIPYVGDVDAHLILDVFDVKQVAAILGNEAIHEQYFSSQVHQSNGQVRTDKPQSSRDEHLFIGKGLLVVLHPIPRRHRAPMSSPIPTAWRI